MAICFYSYNQPSDVDRQIKINSNKPLSSTMKTCCFLSIRQGSLLSAVYTLLVSIINFMYTAIHLSSQGILCKWI